MKVTDKTLELLAELEYIIGDSCYNPDSYNGWTDEYGASFRYPVCYNAQDSKGAIYEEKTRDILKFRPAKSISGAYYKFGANHLCIGRGLQQVLTFIENRYGIDFEELEEKFFTDSIDNLEGK